MLTNTNTSSTYIYRSDGNISTVSDNVNNLSYS